jgi:hypothetical protein
MMTTAHRSTAVEERLPTPDARIPFESSRSRRWTALLDRIAEGDLDACGAFYDESSPLTFSLIMRAVGDRDLAEDMLVGLYVEIRDRAQRGEHRRRNALTWVIDLAQSAAMPRPDPWRPAVQIRQLMPFEIAWLVGGLSAT